MQLVFVSNESVEKWESVAPCVSQEGPASRSHAGLNLLKCSLGTVECASSAGLPQSTLAS
jgi:hypothetical protein